MKNSNNDILFNKHDNLWQIGELYVAYQWNLLISVPDNVLAKQSFWDSEIIEAKIEKPYETDGQNFYHRIIRALGGITIIANAFTSFLAWYVETFKTERIAI